MNFYWHQTQKINFAVIKKFAGFFFFYMNRYFFHPEKHVSQPVLLTPLKYTIMKAFKTGLCTIYPPKKDSRVP